MLPVGAMNEGDRNPSLLEDGLGLPHPTVASAPGAHPTLTTSQGGKARPMVIAPLLVATAWPPCMAREYLVDTKFQSPSLGNRAQWLRG